ncbi:glycoside hydrolase family 15 protein [Streptomyces sp. 900105755]|uniref:glycoside hydrolase family 15 protein n=2 Tax=unclassified Streptomyces TaxID=2593676 RepID=UPI0008979A79|nr:glycoside hydrolase family 15 protein [Streptomyces sp. Ag109_O5-10]SEE86382.1 Glucoamylase (glucan-1,4-alpha-glucosidase), GH15 family [Streptomyces sp. Ag109_O5-10]
MDDYPLIENHGLIGDLQTAALVTTDGAVDWFCSPRFDSPSLFGALLDKDKGGHCTVRPAHPTCSTKQLYLPDTAILVTRFMTEAGAGEVVDFMPVTGTTATDRHRLVRLVRCVRGTMTFDVEIAPRFDYGLMKHQLHITPHGAVFAAEDGTELTVHPVREPEDQRLADVMTGQDADLRVSLTLAAGEQRGLMLETGAEGPPREIRRAEHERLFDETAVFWRTWLARSTYTGRWREVVERSAITLKLMTFAPSGALVAAPTAALPEQLGGERNWDYRFTWIRDASFSVYALLGLGFTEEARAFIMWLGDRVREGAGAHRTTGPLDIMYRVDGSSDLDERILDHWAGYAGSAPVRVGNGAADQLQLDIYGEALDSIYFAHRHGFTLGHAGWTSLRTDLDWLADHWDQAEEGIWETRGGRQDFTYGRVMSWVAFDRALRLAESKGWPSAADRWKAERDAVYEQVMAKGWSEDRQAFVQHYGSEVLDSSLLRMATVGFLTPGDPMWSTTLDAMEDELVSDSLVYRYDPDASPDGLRGSEGTFSLCTFMYVDALARAGRTDRARLVFEKMMGYANHLGLYSEEIDPTGRQLGNFPQAFTHLALIDSALTLDRALDSRRSGPVRQG